MTSIRFPLFSYLLTALLVSACLRAAKVTPAKQITEEELLGEKRYLNQIVSALVASTGFIVSTTAGLAIRIKDAELQGGLADECLLLGKELFDLAGKSFTKSLEPGKLARRLSLQNTQEGGSDLLMEIRTEKFDSIEAILAKEEEEAERLKGDLQNAYQWTSKTFPLYSCRKKAEYERSKVKRRIGLAIEQRTKTLVVQGGEYAQYLINFKQLRSIPAQVAFMEDDNQEKPLLVAKAKQLVRDIAAHAKKLVASAKAFTQSGADLKGNWFVGQAKLLTDLVTSYGMSIDSIRSEHFQYAMVQQVRHLTAQNLLQLNDVVGGFRESIQNSKVRIDFEEAISAGDRLKNGFSAEEMRFKDAEETRCRGKVRLMV